MSIVWEDGQQKYYLWFSLRSRISKYVIAFLSLLFLLLGYLYILSFPQRFHITWENAFKSSNVSENTGLNINQFFTEKMTF